MLPASPGSLFLSKIPHQVIKFFLCRPAFSFKLVNLVTGMHKLFFKCRDFYISSRCM
uniref:Uncharacterized protein n=1 Tax=Arundo donax TaxID=35708 RepID=A0A0A9DTN2_ARUDO